MVLSEPSPQAHNDQDHNDNRHGVSQRPVQLRNDVEARFAADEEAARAILDYALLYAGSEEGQVPYRAWPEGVKGHFITRTPPAGFVVE